MDHTGRLVSYYANLSCFSGFYGDGTANGGEAEAGDQIQNQLEEVGRYRRTTFALSDKILRCSVE
ncbi:hypothetical protein VI817_007196 [Penicillium citrinum]|nr:hypothetical protein VI817_007196 [Penicillium citrinum]